ncbi:MAG: SCO family protein [Bacteroidota bacterium]
MQRRLLLLVLALAAPLSLHAGAADQLLDARTSTAINPRYLLVGHDGQAVTEQDFPGRFQLIAFGYTYCPDICPTTLVEMTKILGELNDDAPRLQAIFISVDPQRDTPAVLKTYTDFFDPRILGLTGSPELVRRAAQNYRVRYAKISLPGTDPLHYSVDHSAGMYLLGPNGEFIRKFAYGRPLAEVIEEIRAQLKRH